MPPASTLAPRSCPRCGQRTTDLHCPNDGAETVQLSSFNKDALSYVEGDLVGGRYTIVAPLGRGGFGAVYTAQHVGTGHNVAVKMLSVDPKAITADVVRRFYREARITAQLTSAHTVRVFDVGQAESGPLYLVMELLRGPTLEQVLSKLARAGETMAEAVAIDLAVQMLKSLAEAHAAGLVHRDLKPANIVLAQMGSNETVVKVLDFGIARTRDSDLTEAGKTIGTPHYMSPEQFRGATLDGRSDLYALGVLLYRCVTGRLPFNGDSPYALMHAHLNDAPTNPREAGAPDLSPGFAACLLRLLAKDPVTRHADAKTLRLELEALAGGAWAGTPMVPYDVEKLVSDSAVGQTEDPPVSGTQPLESEQVSALIGAAGATRMVAATPVSGFATVVGSSTSAGDNGLAAMATMYWADDEEDVEVRDDESDDESDDDFNVDEDRRSPSIDVDAAQSVELDDRTTAMDNHEPNLSPGESPEDELQAKPPDRRLPIPMLLLALIIVGLLAIGAFAMSDWGTPPQTASAKPVLSKPRAARTPSATPHEPSAVAPAKVPAKASAKAPVAPATAPSAVRVVAKPQVKNLVKPAPATAKPASTTAKPAPATAKPQLSAKTTQPTAALAPAARAHSVAAAPKKPRKTTQTKVPSKASKPVKKSSPKVAKPVHSPKPTNHKAAKSLDLDF